MVLLEIREELMIREELTLILYNLFQEIQEEETRPNSSYKANTTMLGKPNTHNATHEHVHENPQQNITEY